MAIDLCNKADLFRAYHTPTSGPSLADLCIETPQWGTLTPHQRHDLDLAFETTLGQADPRLVTGDPAAWSSDFGFALDRIAVRLDARSSEELAEAALAHPDPVMREQA